MDRALGLTTRTVCVGGQTFTLGELTVGALARLVAGIKDRPLKELARLKAEGYLDAETYKLELKDELGRQRADKRGMQEVMDSAMGGENVDLEVAAQLFLAMAARAHPELALADVLALDLAGMLEAIGCFAPEPAEEGSGEPAEDSKKIQAPGATGTPSSR